MNSTVSNHVLIVAGGTGGHIFPGLAVAKELEKNGIKVSWVGTSRGLENKFVGAANIPLFISSFKGVRGKSRLSLFLLPWRLLFSVFEMVKLLRKIKPDFIACFGGYITVPVGLSSIILRTPFLVHEQNAIMGSANRLLSKMAKKVFLSFRITKHAPESAIFVGNPLRESFNLISPPQERWLERSGPLRILVLGGSLGASILNLEIPNILSKASKAYKLNFSVLHQSGEIDRNKVHSRYKNLGINAVVRSFLDEVTNEYSWADLVICRAGAGTVSELATIGVGSILIPLSNAIDNHQMFNAQLLFHYGAALIIEEKNIKGEEILSFFKMHDRHHLLSFAIKAKKCRSIKPASKITDEILKSMDKE